MSLVNPKFDRGSNKVKTSHKTTLFIVLHQTRASQRFFATLTKFDPKLILSRPKIPNFDPPSERVKTSAIVKIIKFSFQQLFISQNRSQDGRDITKIGMTHRSMHHSLPRAITFDPIIGFSRPIPFQKQEVKKQEHTHKKKHPKSTLNPPDSSLFTKNT